MNSIKSVGKHVWTIAEGYIPRDQKEKPREFTSHETACLLNTGDETALVELTLFFSNREPIGPYRIEVPPRRTFHLRFNDLRDPEPVPLETDYSSVFVSNVPIVIQHTRLDSRQSDLSIMTTIAYSE